MAHRPPVGSWAGAAEREARHHRFHSPQSCTSSACFDLHRHLPQVVKQGTAEVHADGKTHYSVDYRVSFAAPSTPHLEPSSHPTSHNIHSIHNTLNSRASVCAGFKRGGSSSPIVRHAIHPQMALGPAGLSCETRDWVLDMTLRHVPWIGDLCKTPGASMPPP